MRRALVLLPLLAFALGMPAQLRAAEPGEAVVVVAGHASAITGLTRDEVTRLYLGERLDGGKAPLKALELDIPPWTREAFSARLLGRSPVQMRALWARLVFSGKGRPPRIVADVDAAMRELESDPNTVVFMPAESAVTARLKPLFAF